MKLTRRKALSALLSIAVIAPFAANVAGAPVDPLQRFEAAPAIDPSIKLTPPHSLDSTMVTVVVRLNGDPITVTQAKQGRSLTASEKQQIRSTLQGQQAAIKPSLQALGATVLAEFQNSLNGIKVSIPRDKLAALARVPGVVEVLPVAIREHENLNGVPLIGAPAVWGAAGGGFHGEGIKIAVLDSGVDFTHANFGGPGTPQAFLDAKAHSTDPADPALFGPNAPKVKGGTDLVGDDYNAAAPAGSPKLIPHPDPNPLDCDGHGSHVSGTATGFGVLSDGTTYPGPYDANTLTTYTFNIGPGVAPKADLYMVRVFGCTGSTNVVDEAIEWAVDHDMDVISMSLGSPFGRSDDSDAVASTNASKAGVIVVAAAGNNGNNPYLVSAPSVGDDVISVAAVDPLPTFPAVSLLLSTGKTVVALNENGVTTLPSGAIPVVVLRNSDGSVSLGCDPAEYIAAGVTGKLVVTARGNCARVARAIFGQKAGAAAVAMINNASGFPPFDGTITSNPDTGEQYTVTIPFLGISGTTPAPVNIVAADGGTATMSATTIANPTFKAVASFSSGGPRNVDSFLKPDVAAPGVSILSTLVGSGNQGTRMSGTSMATPHAAGLAALALQAHPGWSPDNVRRAVVNTANPGQVASYSTRLAGGGLIQAPGAVATGAVAFTDQGTHLGFGFEEIKSDFSKTKPIKVRNLSGAAITFDVTVTNKAGETHTAVPSAAQLTVLPGQIASVDLTLTVPASSVRSSSAFRNVAGVVNLTPTGGGNNGATLRVPYYLVVRGLSNVAAKMAPLPSTNNPSGTVQLTNVGGPIAGNADFYALGIQSNNQQNAPYAIRAVGVQSFPDPIALDPNRQLLVLAINAWGRWNSPATQEFDVYIDVDGDGEPDYVVLSFDFGRITAGVYDGRYGVFVVTLSTGELRSNGFLASAPTDGSTALLPFLSSDLCRPAADPTDPDSPVPPCFSTAHPRMSYQAFGFDLFSDAFNAAQGAGFYNPWTPAISQGDFIPVAPNATASSPVTINLTEWAFTPALGVMVVTTDNAAGAKEAATIPFTLK